MATVSNLLAYVETKTQAGAGTLNNTTTGVPFLNEALLDFRSEMIKRGVAASQLQESYVATVSPPTAPAGSTFAYPSNMYFLKTIEVNMTTGVQQDYVQATLISESNSPDGASFDWLRVNQDKNNPLFADMGDTFEIFPSFTYATNFTNAIKIIYFLTPNPYVNLSDTLAYPDSLNMYILAKKTAAVYFESLMKFAEAKTWNDAYISDLNRLNTTLAQGSEQPISPTPLQGSQTGMAGWAY